MQQHRTITALLILLTSLTARAENWPQWRGPAGDGISSETNLPTTWSEKENILWKLPLPGMSGATPAIWGDRIFVTSSDGNDLVLMCITTDGKGLWKVAIGKGKGDRSRGDEGNEASPSPTTDGKHIWVCFGSGELACVDYNGEVKWKVNLQDRYGKFRYGFGMHMTPVLHGDHLYLQLIHSIPAHVIALDKNDGKEVWKVERKSDGRAECLHSYASPVLWKTDKAAYLITHGNDYAVGHDLKDGSELWRVGDLNPKSKYNATLRFVASPVATPSLIIIPSAKNGPVVALKPDAKGFITTGNEHEQWRRDSNTPDVPSPLVHDGLVYLCRENGILICMEADTGKELYQERTHSQRHRASPVYADGKIYLTARDGTVSVVKAGRTFKLLATNKLDDQTSASPAISGGRIYIRGFDSLYAIGAK
ncbi:MAG: PQQ-binding-like beta-propeller repeat protein [Phycisphaeraceae bacterium]